MAIICLLISSYGGSLPSGDFRSNVFSREIKSRDSSRSQGIKKVETVHSGQPSCLSKREALFRAGHGWQLLDAALE